VIAIILGYDEEDIGLLIRFITSRDRDEFGKPSLPLSEAGDTTCDSNIVLDVNSPLVAPGRAETKSRLEFIRLTVGSRPRNLDIYIPLLVSKDGYTGQEWKRVLSQGTQRTARYTIIQLTPEAQRSEEYVTFLVSDKDTNQQRWIRILRDITSVNKQA